MASNPYVNKVVYGGTTLIDISNTTATADKILSGYGAYGADGRWMDGTAAAGSGSAIAVVDTLDANGGTIRTITAVSLEGDTVAADKLLSGYTAHNSLGEAITGTYVPSSTNTQSNKTVSPTESQQVVAPDTGYDNLAQVTVNAVSSTYVGSGIDRNDSTDLTASGATVTVPAGYYAEQATKSVASGTAGTPTASKGTVSNHAISVTPSVTNTAGYISGGTKTGTAVSVSASELVSGTKTISSSGITDVTNYASASVAAGTAKAPTTISGSSASVSTGTNTLTLTKTVSVTPTVTAGYISSGTATDSSVSLTASVTTKAAATITPTKSTQTIASGTYLTGTQTIAAIPAAYQDVTGVTAAAGDVVSGKTIVDSTGATVNGSLVINKYYTGSSNPSASLGNNGDLYLKV